MENSVTSAPKRRRIIRVAAIAAAVLAAAAAAVIVWQITRTHIHIPQSVTRNVSFPIYIPQKLPHGYTIDESSFKYVPSENVLVFQANDQAGDTLVFSEQRKPSGFNFDDFANKQLIESKKLPNLPFSTTVGKTLDKQTMLLSIVTPTTWIIATTGAELSNQQFHDVAAAINKY